jgi:hypothetical protein
MSLPSSLTTTDPIHIADSYYVYKRRIEDDSTALNYADLLDMLESLKKLLEHINHQDKIIADYSRKVKPYLSGGGEANISRREVRIFPSTRGRESSSIWGTPRFNCLPF